LEGEDAAEDQRRRQNWAAINSFVQEFVANAIERQTPTQGGVFKKHWRVQNAQSEDLELLIYKNGDWWFQRVDKIRAAQPDDNGIDLLAFSYRGRKRGHKGPNPVEGPREGATRLLNGYAPVAHGTESVADRPSNRPLQQFMPWALLIILALVAVFLFNFPVDVVAGSFAVATIALFAWETLRGHQSRRGKAGHQVDDAAALEQRRQYWIAINSLVQEFIPEALRRNTPMTRGGLFKKRYWCVKTAESRERHELSIYKNGNWFLDDFGGFGGIKPLAFSYGRRTLAPDGPYPVEALRDGAMRLLNS
jgi:hypothetical protein